MKWFNVILYISIILSCFGQGLGLMLISPIIILMMIPILFLVGLAQDIKIAKQNRIK